MILKIKAPGEGRHWWIFGELAKIHYHQDPQEYPVEKNLDGPPSYDVELLAKDRDITDDSIKGILLIIRDDKGVETSIIFDTVAYLCNDKGETVERIHGS